MLSLPVHHPKCLFKKGNAKNKMCTVLSVSWIRAYLLVYWTIIRSNEGFSVGVGPRWWNDTWGPAQIWIKYVHNLRSAWAVVPEGQLGRRASTRAWASDQILIGWSKQRLVVGEC